MGLAQQREIEPLYTEEEYLTLEREADERAEYLDGEIYAMAGENPVHGAVSTNLVGILVAYLRGKPCQTFTKDMKIRSGPLPKNPLYPKGLFSYPDLVIVCGRMQFLDEYQDVLVNPTIIIEVLSDTTESFDRINKFQRYKTWLPALKDYVMVSQKQPLVELFHRHRGGVWHYASVNELSDKLSIPAIKCDLRLAEVYDRVVFPPMKEAYVELARRAVPKRKRAKAKMRHAATPSKKRK
ncbi:MAG: Uma2 family endonuclease [Blastocatellia bacterium]